MATGGVGSLATKNICSICLEPFKGRSPKLLPCFHTFCNPCLTQLVDKVISQDTQPGEHKETEIIIKCPTCRKECVVPPGGVAEFQSNFYLDQDEDNQSHLQQIICDLCDQGQVASYHCTRCNLKLCFHCHRSHGTCHITAKSPDNRDFPFPEKSFQELFEKGRDQIKIMEIRLDKLTEDVVELNHQLKKYEDKITDRFNNDMRQLKTHADEVEEKITNERGVIESKRDALKQLLLLDRPSPATLKSLLLSDADVSTMREKLESNTEVEFFKSITASLRLLSAFPIPSDSDLDSSLLFGDGNPLPATAPAGDHEMQTQQTTRLNQLAHNVLLLNRKVDERCTHKDRQELADRMKAVDDKNSILLHEVSAVEDENKNLRQAVLKLQTEFEELSKDHTALFKLTSRISAEFSDLQKDLTCQKNCGQEKIQEEIRNLQDKVTRMSAEITMSSGCSGTQTTELINLEVDPTNSPKSVQLSDIKSVFDNIHTHAAELLNLKDELAKIQHQLMAAQEPASSATQAVIIPGETGKVLSSHQQTIKLSACEDEVRQIKQKISEIEQCKIDWATFQGLKLDFKSLKDELSTKVAFRASLHAVVRTRSVRTLICRDTNFDVGIDYDETSGIFQAPVNGVYLIGTSVLPADSDRPAKIEVRMEPKFQEDEKILLRCKSSDVNIPSIGQTLVFLNNGEAVWLETFEDKSSFSNENNGTQFWGVLMFQTD